MFDFIFEHKMLESFLFYYGGIVSLIGFLGIPIIVLKHIIQQKNFTRLSYIFMSVFLSGFLCFWVYIEAFRAGIVDTVSLFFYIFLTWFTLFSLIGLICLLIVHAVKKVKFSIAEKILLMLFIIGLYSYIPRCLIQPNFDKPLLKTGTQMAIIPFDRQVGYLYLGKFFSHEKRINFSKSDAYQSIKYYEKAIHGKYTKYQQDSLELVWEYISVQDYNKALKIISEAEKNKINLVFFDTTKADIYIMQGKYSEAIDSLLKVKRINIHEEQLFLISALYNELGNAAKSNEYRAKAEDLYNDELKSYARRLNYIEKEDPYKPSLDGTDKTKSRPARVVDVVQERHQIESYRTQYIDKVRKYQTIDAYKKLLMRRYTIFE